MLPGGFSRYVVLPYGAGSALLTVAWGVGGLGCGPAAVGEDATAVPANTYTPEATAILAPEGAPSPMLTPAPSRTPPVTPDWDKLGVDTEAVIAFLGVSTPDADAVSGMPPIALPPLIPVSIATLDLDATRSFLEAHGGTVTESLKQAGVRNWNIWAEMPPALLPALSRRSEVHHAFVGLIYEKVSNRISQQVIEYAIVQGGDQAVMAERYGITVIVEATPEGYANVRRFLEGYGVPITRGNFSSTGIQVIPHNLIVPVSELAGVNFIKGIPAARPAVAPQSEYWGQQTPGRGIRRGGGNPV